ncbi:MAG: hypothetical protein WDO15_15015 [Bacteroidota bacterium]
MILSKTIAKTILTAYSPCADAMDVLGGKWRLPIVGILNFKGKMRFTRYPS